MKKYLITCAVIIAVIVGWISVSRHLGLVISLDNKKQVETFTTVEGKQFFWIRAGEWSRLKSGE